jgi:hypothetical protein
MRFDAPQSRILTEKSMRPLACLFSLIAASFVHAAEFPRPALPDLSAHGTNIQRTMRLLTESTPDQRHPVRVLFYGQSITEQTWSKQVADDLRSRFPHADLVVENRALGGFASQMLVKCVETDVVSFQPDLVIFHVYGAHDKYEAILRTIRRRTTAEILQQNDHFSANHNLDENTEAEANRNPQDNWTGFMNHHWLPQLSMKYRTEFCDQRSIWRQYLVDNQLQPQALLKDNVHLNEHGNFLMAEIVKAHLRYDPSLGKSPAEDWVKTIRVGSDVHWSDERLSVEFDGAGVAAVVEPADSSQTLQFTIDGRRPSEFSELSAHGRSKAQPGGKWPPIAPIGFEKPLVPEAWTLEAKRDEKNENAFTFNLTGSVTGPDGEGRSDQNFVSNSGRVVIEPDAWNVRYALALAQVKPAPAELKVTWNVEPRYVDQWPVDAKETDNRGAASRLVWIAHGLPAGRHVLGVTGTGRSSLKAIHVHRPPLASE